MPFRVNRGLSPHSIWPVPFGTCPLSDIFAGSPGTSLAVRLRAWRAGTYGSAFRTESRSTLNDVWRPALHQSIEQWRHYKEKSRASGAQVGTQQGGSKVLRVPAGNDGIRAGARGDLTARLVRPFSLPCSRKQENSPYRKLKSADDRPRIG
jgi:hypothetical protein